ncbi:alkaline shock response membrane anchor protein AmaP [Streptomyces sp. 142MFCol3.1]|uniref:alkaline shock response membrane anchor protein AmaP n=1 Tax=Streptomyces sp. 142MFCol3.1 TaxID=1172179 RepID=UPI000400E8EF|nr:alkaline shock response membrane anchor protein AmaP [Streptomyces sp. 142MFCol3.1]
MNGRSTLNRLLLAVSGLVLLGGGLLVLAAGLDLYRRLHLAPPADWPWATPHDVLLSRADRTRWSDQGWWWPAVIAGLFLTVVLALLWLLAQVRRHRPDSVDLGGTRPPDNVELRASALSDAITTETRALTDVEHAHVHISGRPAHPRLRVALTLTEHGAPGPVLQALCTGPVARARDCTGVAHLPARARFDVGRHKARRVH